MTTVIVVASAFNMSAAFALIVLSTKDFSLAILTIDSAIRNLVVWIRSRFGFEDQILSSPVRPGPVRSDPVARLRCDLVPPNAHCAYFIQNSRRFCSGVLGKMMRTRRN